KGRKRIRQADGRLPRQDRRSVQGQRKGNHYNLMADITPRHVGYVVDGNRRWAKKHGIPTYEGHLAGYNAIQEVVSATFDEGVEYVSAYIFSTENWKRGEGEVKKLMSLVLKLLTSDLHLFDE